MRMRHIAIRGLSDSTIFFPHYLINGTIFEKKKLLNTKHVFWFSLQLVSETFLILRTNEWDMIKKMYNLSSRKVPAILVRSEFSRWFFSKNPQISNFMKIRPVGAECSMRTCGRTDGWTDRTKLIVDFRNFANAP